MGVDYLSCKKCGTAFPDVIDYVHCENCYEVNNEYTHWCCEECAELDGYKSSYCTHYDRDEEECTLIDEIDCVKKAGYKDCASDDFCTIESCGYCRKENYTEEQLLEFMFEHFNITREEIIKLKNNK